MHFLGLIVAAIVIEGIVSYFRMMVSGGNYKPIIATMALGVFVAVNYQIDIFAIIGMQPLIPYVGVVLTGILISRGSNYAYELVKLITTYAGKLSASL